jgi:hypothetical protein
MDHLLERHRRQVQGGRKAAEECLTKVVLEGSWHDKSRRHWQGKVGMVGMLPKAVDGDENQARHLVPWILGFDR